MATSITQLDHSPFFFFISISINPGYNEMYSITDGIGGLKRLEN